MIDILLAAYNGEKYVSEQIESIINQTYTEWILYIKDDCSTDNTINIIKAYEERYKDKIKVIVSNKPTGSAKDNFFSMLKYATNEYVMTCDQDDIWLPDKIKMTYLKMLEEEVKNKDIPILVHTDLKVVDNDLNIISESLLKMQNLDSNRNRLNNLLVQNIVTGCTVMFNRNLLNYIKSIPQKAVMHDWWMALIASSIGKIAFIQEPTVLYRQHVDNGVGAKDANSLKYIITMMNRKDSIKRSVYNTYLQSGDLLSVIGESVEKNEYNLIEQYFLLHKYNKIKKIYILFKYRLFKKGLLKNIGYLLFC